MIYDVIVVGAGPAGCTAARELARAHQKVLLLEKKKLPRYKACGGGVTRAGLELLDFDCTPVIEARVDRVRYTYAGKDPVEIAIGKPIVAMVMRDRFDYLLAEKAAEAGAELIDGVEVSAVKLNKNSVKVSAGKMSWEGRYLIGADGALSVVAKLTSAYKTRSFAAALEVELPYRVPWDKKLAEFGFGVIDGGYAWAFPKREVLSVGIGALGDRSKMLQEKLFRWLEHLGYQQLNEVIHGHPLPYFRRQVRLARGNVLLAGDAAQLMDPLSGEGIKYALLSGKLAARALLHNDMDLYVKEVEEQIISNLKISSRLAHFFYTFPKFSYDNAVKNPAATQLFARMMAGEISYREIWEKARRRMFRSFPWSKGRPSSAD